MAETLETSFSVDGSVFDVDGSVFDVDGSVLMVLC